MNNPEGIKALVAKWRAEVERGTGHLNDEADRAMLSCADELESLTAVAEPEEESRAITALKVTLFETECYLPASIAKRVQAACTVAVAGDAEGVAKAWTHCDCSSYDEALRNGCIPPPDTAPVAFAIELADGTISPLGWMGMQLHGGFKKFTDISDGCHYVYAYRGKANAPR